MEYKLLSFNKGEVLEIVQRTPEYTRSRVDELLARVLYNKTGENPQVTIEALLPCDEEGNVLPHNESRPLEIRFVPQQCCFFGIELPEGTNVRSIYKEDKQIVVKDDKPSDRIYKFLPYTL